MRTATLTASAMARLGNVRPTTSASPVSLESRLWTPTAGAVLPEDPSLTGRPSGIDTRTTVGATGWALAPTVSTGATVAAVATATVATPIRKPVIVPPIASRSASTPETSSRGSSALSRGTVCHNDHIYTISLP